MATRRIRIALLIDADNATASLIDDIMRDVAGRGDITVRRAFGDWASPHLQQWRAKLHASAIVPVQQFAYSPGKNATDMAMVINAMDLLHSGTVDAFALVSSDSDFTPLAVRIREAGLDVYGYGHVKTAEAFQRACTHFTIADRLAAPSVPTRSVTRPTPAGTQKPASSVTATDVVATSPAKPSPTSAKKPASPKEVAKKVAKKTAKKTAKKQPPAAAPAAASKARRDKLRGDTRLMNRLRSAVAATADENGWAAAASVGKELRRTGPFDPSDHGSATLTKLMTLTGLFEIRDAGTSTSFRDPKAASG
jgi:uncharacterized LabA/DUF88 family protein